MGVLSTGILCYGLNLVVLSQFVEWLLICRRRLRAGGPSSGMLLSVFIMQSLIASRTCGAMALQHGRRSLMAPSLTT